MAKILVVDDVEDIVFMMSSVLETFGHELRIASNGLEAFDVAAAFLPEIVFMDLDMPVLNGLDAARLIKSRLPFKPYLVAVTGNAIDGLHAAARAAGFDLCVRKPAGIGVLLAIIDGVAPEGREGTLARFSGRGRSADETVVGTAPTKKPTLGSAFVSRLRGRIWCRRKGSIPETRRQLVDS